MSIIVPERRGWYRWVCGAVTPGAADDHLEPFGFVLGLITGRYHLSATKRNIVAGERDLSLKNRKVNVFFTMSFLD